MQQSKNYKNGQFHNLSKTPALAEGVTYFSALKEMLFPKTLYTKPTDSIPFVNTNLSTLDKNTDFLVWFGHSSYFMIIDQTSYLIDPMLKIIALAQYGNYTVYK